MKKIIFFLYIAFLVLFLDGISASSIFHGYTTAIILYAVVLVLLKCIETRSFKLKILRSNRNIRYSFLILIALYIGNTLRPSTAIIVAVQLASFLTIAYLNAYYAKKYNLINEYILFAYVLFSLSIIKQFIDGGMPFEIYSNVSNIFKEDRYRVAFGFYHVNAGGNLSACSVILSIYIYYTIILNNFKKLRRNILTIVLFGIDFFLITYLLSTGSRNAILAVLVFIFIFVYYKIILFRTFNQKQRFILRIVFVIVLLGSTIASLGSVATSLFISSNRLKNFTSNLPVLNSTLKWVFGIGISGSSKFTKGLYPVDNYYLYLILTTGIFGVFVFFVAVYFIGKQLYQNVIYAKSNQSIIVLAIFISHLISGMGEVCVLYYLFPSSLIYFMMYYIYGDVCTIQEVRK